MKIVLFNKLKTVLLSITFTVLSYNTNLVTYIKFEKLNPNFSI